MNPTIRNAQQQARRGRSAEPSFTDIRQYVENKSAYDEVCDNLIKLREDAEAATAELTKAKDLDAALERAEAAKAQAEEVLADAQARAADMVAKADAEARNTRDTAAKELERAQSLRESARKAEADAQEHRSMAEQAKREAAELRAQAKADADAAATLKEEIQQRLSAIEKAASA